MLGRAAGRLPNSNLLRTMARIYAVSDLHVDVQQNLHWLASWSSSAFKNDMLIVAGDVTDNMSLLKSTLRSLTERFAQVFYVPGKREILRLHWYGIPLIPDSSPSCNRQRPRSENFSNSLFFFTAFHYHADERLVDNPVFYDIRRRSPHSSL